MQKNTTLSKDQQNYFRDVAKEYGVKNALIIDFWKHGAIKAPLTEIDRYFLESFFLVINKTSVLRYFAKKLNSDRQKELEMFAGLTTLEARLKKRFLEKLENNQKLSVKNVSFEVAAELNIPTENKNEYWKVKSIAKKMKKQVENKIYRERAKIKLRIEELEEEFLSDYKPHSERIKFVEQEIIRLEGLIPYNPR